MRMRGSLVRALVVVLLGVGVAAEAGGRGPLRVLCEAAEDRLAPRVRDTAAVEVLGPERVLDCSPL